MFRTEYDGHHAARPPRPRPARPPRRRRAVATGRVMKFLTITLIAHAPTRSPAAQKSTSERFREVVDNALLAEELGFDGFGVGERHERPFISSSPPVVLSHIAALTRTIRLFTAVTTLSLLDPVRAFEDYATLDHLSGGRLELIIGKGNGAAQGELFHVTAEDQWDRNREGYELFRRLWREDKVTWSPRFRPRADRGRGLAAPAAAADPGLARQRHQQGVGRPGRPLRRPAVLRQRHQPHRAVRRADPLLPGALGALRPRPGRRPRSARAPPATTPPAPRRTPSSAYRPIFDAHLARSSAGSASSRSSPRSRTRRAQLGADRQPAAGHRQGAPLPRAVRPRGACTCTPTPAA